MTDAINTGNNQRRWRAHDKVSIARSKSL